MFESPDAYVILKIIDNNEIQYRLYSCWYGGYLDSDSWRLNSGITSIEENDDWNGGGTFYFVYGNSDTIYHIHDYTYKKLSSYCQGKLQEIIGDYNVEIIDIAQYLKEQPTNVDL